MKSFFLHFIVLVAGVTMAIDGASAQKIGNVRSKLGARSDKSGAKVLVVEDRSTQNAIAAVEANKPQNTIEGYRVVLFYDDAQYSQERANGVLAAFKKEHPEINSYIVYEKPYFKVSVGDCVTVEEAIVLRSKLIRTYSGAFIRRDNISLNQLSNVRRRVDCYTLDPEVRNSLLYDRSLRDKMRQDQTMYTIMQRDPALKELLLLDDLGQGQGDSNRSTEDPEWIGEW